MRQERGSECLHHVFRPQGTTPLSSQYVAPSTPPVNVVKRHMDNSRFEDMEIPSVMEYLSCIFHGYSGLSSVGSFTMYPPLSRIRCAGLTVDISPRTGSCHASILIDIPELRILRPWVSKHLDKGGEQVLRTYLLVSYIIFVGMFKRLQYTRFIASLVLKDTKVAVSESQNNCRDGCDYYHHETWAISWRVFWLENQWPGELTCPRMSCVIPKYGQSRFPTHLSNIRRRSQMS